MDRRTHQANQYFGLSPALETSLESQVKLCQLITYFTLPDDCQELKPLYFDCTDEF